MTWSPILTAREVSEIKALAHRGTLYRVLAAEYGVSLSCVKAIMAGRTWVHIQPAKLRDEDMPHWRGVALPAQAPVRADLCA